MPRRQAADAGDDQIVARRNGAKIVEQAVEERLLLGWEGTLLRRRRGRLLSDGRSRGPGLGREWRRVKRQSNTQGRSGSTSRASILVSGRWDQYSLKRQGRRSSPTCCHRPPLRRNVSVTGVRQAGKPAACRFDGHLHVVGCRKDAGRRLLADTAPGRRHRLLLHLSARRAGRIVQEDQRSRYDAIGDATPARRRRSGTSACRPPKASVPRSD